MTFESTKIPTIADHSEFNFIQPFLVFITCIYYLFVSLGHDFVTQLYVGIFNNFGRSKMESGMLFGFIFLSIFIAVALTFYISKHKSDFKLSSSILWLIGGISLIICYQLLIVTNIEMIHFVQYAIFGTLLCLFIKDHILVLGIVFIGGVLDEFIQFYLHPSNTMYLDFNDFILDGSGGLIGILIYSSVLSKFYFSMNSMEKQLKVTLKMVYIILIFAYFISLYTGYSVMYYKLAEPESIVQLIDGKNTFVFSYFRAESFWSVSNYGREYHILTPVWGTIAVITQFCLYSLCFKFISSKSN
ncbi:MAG: hypothetical protein COA79_15530 [Planctomycetota bacterium]|nr:MAG: hypothetical protein COA79_15530 [Planctomycetota bacterium]